MFQALAPLRDSLSRLLLLLDSVDRVKEGELRGIEASSLRAEKISDWLARGAEASAIVLLLIMARFLYTWLFRPLHQLTLAIREYKNGDHTVRVPVEGQKIDDIREAALSFNDMAYKLDLLEQQRYSYLAATAHDLRNPLGVIKSVAGLLKKRQLEGGGKENARLLALIDEQIDRLGLLADDMVDRQQVQSGCYNLKLEEADVCTLVKISVKLWAVTAKRHLLTLSCTDESTVAKFDVRRLQQALHNLLSNAIKYSPSGGEVSTVVRTEPDSIIVEVSDAGVGILPEDRERIFEPFRRSQATRDLVPGTGLGLASTRKIIEAHGGKIEVESEVGKGSTFRLVIPKGLAVRQTA
jgi:signal transduction histidine kinase